MGSTGVYWGLGLQLHFMEDWYATLKIAQMYFGGGFKSELMHDNGHVYAKYYITSAIHINQYSLNIEKEFWRSKPLNISNAPINLSTKALFGIKINQIGNFPLIDTFSRYDNRGLYFTQTSNVIHLNSVALDIGGSTQLFINNKQSLTLGVIYSYGFQPIEKEHYEIDYFYHGLKDEFTVLTGKHSLLLYAAYPIVLYRNKAQRDLIGKKRRNE